MLPLPQNGKDREMVQSAESREPEIRSPLFAKYRPAVLRFWLRFTAGSLWSGVGILLCIVACHWFSTIAWPGNAIGVALGFGGGFVVYRYGFSKIAAKNIARIAGQPEKVCVFAFQAWRSYLLIVVMVFLGYSLRHSHLSLAVLAAIYACIGTALALSSCLYFEQLF